MKKLKKFSLCFLILVLGMVFMSSSFAAEVCDDSMEDVSQVDESVSVVGDVSSYDVSQQDNQIIADDEVQGVSSDEGVVSTYGAGDFGAEDDVSTYTMNTGSFDDLQDKINTATKTNGSYVVYLNNTNYLGNGHNLLIDNTDADWYIYGGYTVTDGLQSILDAQKLSGILMINNSVVYIEGIQFINGNKNDGGAIYNMGNLSIANNNNFINNSAGDGGAIFNDWYSNLSIANGNCFVNNTAVGYGGGAIYNHYCAIVNIGESNSFVNNSAMYDGGAICNSGNLTIGENNNFIDNYAVRDGGAICNSGNLTIGDGNSFINNTVASGYDVTPSDFSYGGVIFNIEGNLRIGEMNSFVNNSADVGGVIYNYAWDGIFSVGDNNSFVNNSAGIGGVIYNNAYCDADDGILSIGDGNSFVNNSARYCGGVIYNSVDDCGGLYCYLSVGENNSFVNNSAVQDGGVIWNNASLTIAEGNNFINNSANIGGAIYNSGNLIIGANSNFVNNTASDFGGAICNSYYYNNKFFNFDYFSISDSGYGNLIICDNNTFINNSAVNDGGAIYNRGNFNIDDNTIFMNNTAVYGGAIYNDHSTYYDYWNNSHDVYSNLTMGNGNSFVNNFALNYGGAIFNNASLIIGEANSFVNNSANQSGGAIYNQANLFITDCGFVNNSAVLSGGVVYNRGNLILVNNTMVNCTCANVTGGNYIFNAKFANVFGMIDVLNLTYLGNQTVYGFNGETVVVDALLTDDRGNPVTGNNVSFVIDGKTYFVNVVEGVAKISFVIPDNASVGTVYDVTGDYFGKLSDLTVNNGAIIVNKIYESMISVSTNNDTYYGDELVFVNGNLVNSDLGQVIVNANVNLTLVDQLGNRLLSVVVVTDAFGNYYYNFTNLYLNEYNVLAEFVGNGSIIGSEANTGFEVIANLPDVPVIPNGTDPVIPDPVIPNGTNITENITNETNETEDVNETPVVPEDPVVPVVPVVPEEPLVSNATEPSVVPDSNNPNTDNGNGNADGNGVIVGVNSIANVIVDNNGLGLGIVNDARELTNADTVSDTANNVQEDTNANPDEKDIGIDYGKLIPMKPDNSWATLFAGLVGIAGLTEVKRRKEDDEDDE